MFFYVPGCTASIELCLRRTLVRLVDYSAENSHQKKVISYVHINLY